VLMCPFLVERASHVDRQHFNRWQDSLFVGGDVHGAFDQMHAAPYVAHMLVPHDSPNVAFASDAHSLDRRVRFVQSFDLQTTTVVATPFSSMIRGATVATARVSKLSVGAPCRTEHEWFKMAVRPHIYAQNRLSQRVLKALRDAMEVKVQDKGKPPVVGPPEGVSDALVQRFRHHTHAPFRPPPPPPASIRHAPGPVVVVSPVLAAASPSHPLLAAKYPR